MDGELASPTAVEVAPNGDIWVADSGNARIRRISGTRIESALGTGDPLEAGLAGEGETVPIGTPAAMRITADGTAIYIWDAMHRRILRVEVD